MNLKLFYDPKAPEDIAPYSLDFNDWVIPATSSAPADTVITASVTTVCIDNNSDHTLVATGALINKNVVTTMLSGGTVNKVYLVHFLITTTQGLTIVRSPSIQVLAR